MLRTALNALNTWSHITVTTNEWSQAIVPRLGRLEIPLSQLSTLPETERRWKYNFIYNLLLTQKNQHQLSLFPEGDLKLAENTGWQESSLNCSHSVAGNYNPKIREVVKSCAQLTIGNNIPVAISHKHFINLCSSRTYRGLCLFSLWVDKGHHSTMGKLPPYISTLHLTHVLLQILFRSTGRHSIKWPN